MKRDRLGKSPLITGRMLGLAVVAAALAHAASAQQRISMLDSLITFEAPDGWPIADEKERAASGGSIARSLSVGSWDESPWLECDALTLPRQSLGAQQQTANQMMMLVPQSVAVLPTDELLHYSTTDIEGVSIRQSGTRSDDIFSEIWQFWLIDGPMLHTVQIDCTWLDDGSDTGNEEARKLAHSFFASMKIVRP